MKKSLNLFIALIIFIGLSLKVNAASINTKEVTLYYTTDTYADKLNQPSSFIKEYQLQVTGGEATYKVIEGDSARVSNTGLITPRVDTYYCKGNVCSTYLASDETYDRTFNRLTVGDSKIEVTVGSEKFEVMVHVIDYASYNAEQIMKDYVNKNITSSMNEYEKMEKIMEFISNTKYSVSSSSYAGLISGDGADCIGDSQAIVYMSKLVGIKAHMRYANRDQGAGNNHYNVAAVLDGAVYVVDVVSTKSPPRSTKIVSTDNGFSLGNTGYYFSGDPYLQYDGYEENPVIPETMVPALGNWAMYYGSHSETKVKTVTVPKTITKIGVGAFNRVNTLTDVIVSPDNPNYMSKDGILYSKNGEIIYSYPSGRKVEGFALYTNVTEISDYAFSYNENLKEIILNSGLKKIGKYAFTDVDNMAMVVIPETVTLIDDYAFDLDTHLVVKNPGATLGIKLCSAYRPIYGLKGSTTEEYAKINGCPFGEITAKQTNFKSITETTITSTPVEIKDNDENRPNLKIMDGDYELKENVDYKIVEILNNTYPTQYAAARIMGIGNYVGYVQHNYVITTKTIKYKYTNPVVDYNGQEQSPIIEVESEGVTIKYGDTAYSNLSSELKKYKMPGTYTFGISLTGKNYESVYVSDLKFTIKGIDISDATISDVPNYVYDGFQKRPAVKVIKDGKELIPNTDYLITYAKCYGPGVATIRVVGRGIYEGVIEKNYMIYDKNDIEISLPSNVTMSIGSKGKLNLKVTPEVSITPTWRSLNQSVIRVNKDGTTEAVGLGTAVVEARFGNKIATTTVTVTDFLKGDLDEDSTITVDDAVEALYYYIEKNATTSHKLAIGDMDNDGRITVDDAVDILMLYVNK